MKKVMFALCFMFGGIVVLTAQDTQDTTSNQYRTETQSQYPQDQMGQLDQDRERIQATELPDEVKRALEGEEYRGWLISGAFKSKGSADQSMGADTTSTDPNRQGNANATGAEDEEVYIVELKNGAETKSVRFDSKGQKLEGEGMEGDQNSQNNQYNQNQQNDQLNQNDQMDQTTPADQARPTDPNATDQPDQSQSGQSQSTNQTPSEQSTPSDQSTQQSTETETQTDQSKANEPK